MLDILLASLVAFVVLPIVCAGLGNALHSIGPNSPFATLSGLLFAFGISGLFAWPLAPIVIGIAWWACQRGWIGWASPIALGVPLAYVYGVVLSYFFLFAHEPLETILRGSALFGAFYAGVGSLALWRIYPEIYSAATKA